jgi:polo-like kinase 1
LPVDPGKKPHKLTDVVYVKKWMRTRHAIMFRLSNKVVQVNFQDQTEIMLSSETKVVTYVNKKGERSNYPLSTAMESSNLEMVKRLKYTKDILTHMLQTNAGEAPKTSGGIEASGNQIGASQSQRPATTGQAIEGGDFKPSSSQKIEGFK